MTQPSKKAKTARIQKSLETREKYPISFFDSRKYIQHNVNLEDGLGPILAFMDALPAERTKVDVLRSFEDGEFSFAHAEYELGDWGQMVGFEVHRWENDRIVEHWDNLQSTASTPNGSGRSMTDGSATLTDLDHTAENKVRVRSFTEQTLIGRDALGASAWFKDAALIQHSPSLSDGFKPYIEQLSTGWETGAKVYERLHLLLGEGNFVLAASSGAIEGNAAAFYDLYRLEHGFIAEHWDVLETVTPERDWKNRNGKF